ncbi:hypothetical protein GCM10017771_61370 [Streptomyces capitiformicae]|uniref:Uncharacterized protein n=1 Tax=Streptomyces capitiformicae TaxID=2014920 RepID=A0A918ZA71_9ACTN|nr:hypothetical protein GCM10017771_61370 [Streptomyces capitiformicae]
MLRDRVARPTGRNTAITTTPRVKPRPSGEGIYGTDDPFRNIDDMESERPRELTPSHP